MVTFNPYLNFMGQTKSAMEFYMSVFGGTLTVQTYADGGMSKKPEEANLVMHSMLQTDAFMFMAADGNEEHKAHPGDTVKMSLSGDDEDTLSKYFAGLSDGATVVQPLVKAPWGDTFGMLIDKFGIHWMVNISAKK